MATDNDDEFSGFFGDDSGGFFDEPQEPSSAPDTPESQEEAPPEEPDEDEDDGELNELAGTGAGTVARLNPEIRHQIMAQANSRAWTRHERHVVMRRAMSAGKLEEIIDWYPRSGQSIHILSCGEVDLFSCLHFMLRQRPYAYILLSTFSLGYMEIRNLHEYLEKGVIGRLDVYAGSIFRNRTIRTREYDALVALHQRFPHCFCGLANVHAKVIAGIDRDNGEGDFVVEASANANLNFRVEQACLTMDTDLALFYKEAFDGVDCPQDAQYFKNVRRTPWVVDRKS